MKHRQVRQGTFETNSSSTHAFTLYANNSAEAEYKPIVKGPVKVYGQASTNERWNNKMATVLGYLYLEGRKGEIDNLIQGFGEWAGETIVVDYTEIDKVIERWKVDTEGFFENYSEVDDYGYGNSIEDIRSIMDDVVSTPEKFRSFVCSTGWIEVNEYYDG